MRCQFRYIWSGFRLQFQIVDITTDCFKQFQSDFVAEMCIRDRTNTDPIIAIMPTSIETLVRILLSGDRRRSLSIIFSTSYPPSIHFKNRITGIDVYKRQFIRCFIRRIYFAVSHNTSSSAPINNTVPWIFSILIISSSVIG